MNTNKHSYLNIIKPSKVTSSSIITFTILMLSGLFSGCSFDAAQDSKADVALENDAFAQEKVLTSLVDFENEKQIQWIKSDKTKFTSVSQNMEKQLAITFLKAEHNSELIIKPDTAWNLSSYSDYNLAFDVENTGKESIHLYLNVETPDGHYQSRSISLPQHYKGTVYFPLHGREAQVDTGMWGDAKPWETTNDLMVWRSWKKAEHNFSTISALRFFTLGILENKSVLIDDIRVRKNPKPDPNWMVGVIDKYGQNAKYNTALDVHSDEQLKAIASEELAQLAVSKGMPHRSKFGGYTQGPKLKATGYFRTEKVDGKWWMVDPEGNIFFSHGPANVRMANMTTITGIDYRDSSIRLKSNDEITPEDSMGIIKIPNEIRNDRYVISELRHNMFEWLPSYDGPLAEHYSYRRSTHKGPVPYGETFSFYRANLERRYGETSTESYVKKWHQVTAERMHDWGFTSFGNWVDPAFYQSEQVPYFANGWIIGDFKTLSGKTNHWGLMPDPYDPVFAERAKITIDAIAKNIQGSPWCAGIFIDNEKSWGEREGPVDARYGVILDALSKSTEESPAKKAYAKHLKAKYVSIEKLNTAWQSNIKNWHTFDAGVEFSSFSAIQIADLSKMLEMLGEQYFTVVHNTLAKVLPHHLYMGARMANWGMPDEIIKASLKYSDVLSFNIYEEGMQEHFWKFLEEVDLPVVIGEFHIGTATDSGMFNPGIVHAANQTDRAKMYKTYMQSVLTKPYMVGAHWFQYIDEPISGRAFDGENANIGFVTVTDIPYPEMIKAVKEVTSTMYQQRYTP